MPFGECTITLQDMAYQLGLPVDGRYVSDCLTDFHIYIQGGRPAWVWFQELLGVLPPANQVQKFAMNCTWFQETFGECPTGTDEETVRRFARAYIMMLLGTQLFTDKSGNRIHIRWLPYVARLEEMGGYSWGSAALAWLYRCMSRVANRYVVKLADPLQLLQSWIFWRFPRFRPAGYDEFSWPLASRWSSHNPSGSEKGPRVQMWRLRIDMLQARDFIWMLYSSPDVLQVDHPEVLEPRHTTLWRCVTALIYFAVVEWHQIDRTRDPYMTSWTGGVSMEREFGGSHFLDEITAIIQQEETARRGGQSSETHAPLDVDLNDPPSVPVPDYFALGGTPPFAYATGSHSFARPSRALVRGESFPSGSSSQPLDV
ncbi:protein MAIN-LIKE 1-like [Arachis duranensis]|uniref:Protein MAIN-LIKE 1-like n=1 Tax=Arachis duranensis TaxID=130453 RepID=A0A6P4DAH8_ARADU|nr:protein MAIN-LIKE 1-like [Arachis duranensis]